MLRFAHHLDGIKAKGSDYCSWTCSICNGHTALFKIMFQPHDVVSAELNELTRDMFLKKTNASYQVLREACAAFGQSTAMTKSNSTTNNSP